MFYLTVFVIPAMFVFVLGLLDWLVSASVWEEWLIDLGWDCHVLAWGGLGGVFSNTSLRRILPDGEAAAVELVCVAVLLLLAVLMLFLRRKKPPVGWKAFVSLAAGGCALAIPIEIAFRAHM